MKNLTIIFPYMTVVEDNMYYPDHELIYESLHEISGDKALQKIDLFMQEHYECSFIDEIRRKKYVRDPFKSRVIQTFLYIALARLAEHRFGNAKAYGGYCAGIVPALSMAGSLSHEGLIELRESFDSYMNDMVQSFIRKSIFSSVVDFNKTGLAIDEAKSIMDQYASDALFLKDSRSERAWEIIGDRAPLLAALAEISEKNINLLSISETQKDTIAHTPMADKIPFQNGLKNLNLSAPRIPVYTSSGVNLHSGVELSRIPECFETTMFDQIDSHNYLKSLLELDSELLYIGSERTLVSLLRGTTVDQGRIHIFAPSSPDSAFNRKW